MEAVDIQNKDHAGVWPLRVHVPTCPQQHTIQDLYPATIWYLLVPVPPRLRMRTWLLEAYSLMKVICSSNGRYYKVLMDYTGIIPVVRSCKVCAKWWYWECQQVHRPGTGIVIWKREYRGIHCSDNSSTCDTYMPHCYLLHSIICDFAREPMGRKAYLV